MILLIQPGLELVQPDLGLIRLNLEATKVEREACQELRPHQNLGQKSVQNYRLLEQKQHRHPLKLLGESYLIEKEKLKQKIFVPGI